MIHTTRGVFQRDTLAYEILLQRDQGRTLQNIADDWGLATRQQARTLWIRGLRNAGRESEIQSRQIQVSFGGHTYLVDSNDMNDTFTFSTNFEWTTFGVEIECYNAGQSRSVRALRAVAIEAEQEGYNHHTRQYWKATSDASIHGNSPCEVVSPVLRGDEGLREMRTAMTALRESDARINASCGGHVHIGINGYITEQGQVNIIRRWWKVNRAMEMLVLPQRRNNRWCKRSSKAHCDEVAQEWQAGLRYGQADRYMDLNLQAWGRQGTFENRVHNGSLNGKNHGAWVILNQAVMLFLASSTTEEVDRVMGDDFISSGGFFNVQENGSVGGFPTSRMVQREEGAEVNVRCEEAMRRLAAMLLIRGYITEEVAAHLNARVEWIKNRNNRGESRGQ